MQLGQSRSPRVALVTALGTEGDSSRLIFCIFEYIFQQSADNRDVLQSDNGDQGGGGLPLPGLQEPPRHHERRQAGLAYFAENTEVSTRSMWQFEFRIDFSIFFYPLSLLLV